MIAVLKASARFWTSWLGGIAICALAGAILAAAIMFGGIYNTGADNPHLRIVAWAIHRTMISSVQRRAADNRGYSRVDRATLLAGTKVYEAHCLACHGGPGVTRAPWAAGMLPTPPYIIDSRARWTRAELHELIAHGVKMSAMPAWQEILPEKQIGDVTALVEAMPQLTVAQFNALRVAVRARPTTPLEASGPAASIAPLPFDETQPLSRTVEPAPSVHPRASP